MTHLSPVLSRLAAMVVLLAGYTFLVLPAVSRPGDANIGAGLLAFLGLAAIGFLGALVDAWRHGTRTALGWWTTIAVGLAVVWWLMMAAFLRDDSISFVRLLVLDVALLPFAFLLVAAPASLGALLTLLVRRR